MAEWCKICGSKMKYDKEEKKWYCTYSRLKLETTQNTRKARLKE